MNLKPLTLSLLACALAGCSTPMTQTERPTMERRVDWIKDWDHMADDATTDFLSRYPGNRNAVFIMPQQPNLAFAAAYKKLLQEKFLERGVNVSETPGHGSTVLTFNVQTFLYDCKEPTPEFAKFAFNDAEMSSDCTKRMMPAVFAPIGAVFDALGSIYDTTRAEVLLTLTVSNGEFLQYQKTTEFFTRPSDLAAFYQDALGSDMHEGHWLNGNHAAAIWAEWPENWDSLPGPERAAIRGGGPSAQTDQ